MEIHCQSEDRKMCGLTADLLHIKSCRVMQVLYRQTGFCIHCGHYRDEYSFVDIVFVIMQSCMMCRWWLAWRTWWSTISWHRRHHHHYADPRHVYPRSNLLFCSTSSDLTSPVQRRESVRFCWSLWGGGSGAITATIRRSHDDASSTIQPDWHGW